MYKIDRKNLKKERNMYLLFFVIGLLFFVIFNLAILSTSLVFTSFFDFIASALMGVFVSSLPLLIVWLITGVCMYLGLKNLKRIKEKNKLYDRLEVNGELVKNLKYKMQDTGVRVNDIPIYRIVAEYDLGNGTKIPLYGDGRFDGKFADSDGLVDALIDPTNPENYYLDFNIDESCMDCNYKILDNVDSEYSYENNCGIEENNVNSIQENDKFF